MGRAASSTNKSYACGTARTARACTASASGIRRPAPCWKRQSSALRLQLPAPEFIHGAEQMRARRGPGDAMGLVGVHQQLVGLAGIDQGVDELLGVLPVHVVVA